MQYLCRKQLPAGGGTYRPGEIIPDGVILPERALALEKMGYISKVDFRPFRKCRDRKTDLRQNDIPIPPDGFQCQYLRSSSPTLIR